jgi:SAM-dependent methyltransferase
VAKLHEITFMRRLYSLMGEAAGTRFAREKPFSHDDCSRYLIDMGRLLEVLPPPPARVLDLGVGPGWTSQFLARRGYEVVGQDICTDVLDLATASAREAGLTNVRFVAQDYESMDYREEFDAALFYDALHHAENERAALAAVYAALKPGGVCVTLEPGEGHATSEPTKQAVETFGVTEKDMPPRHIIAVAKSVGFRSFKVFRRDDEIEPALVADSAIRPAPVSGPAPVSRFAVAVRFLRKATRVLLYGPCEEDHVMLYKWQRPAPPDELRQGNIVWLQK